MGNTVKLLKAKTGWSVYKKTAVLALSLALLLSVRDAFVYAAETPFYTVTEKQASESRGEMTVTGILPVVSISMGGKAFEKEINDKITAEYENVKASYANKHASIEFSYDVKVDGECVSVLLKSDVVTSTSSIFVKSVNFNGSTGEMLTINTVLGPNGTKLANMAIEDEINKNIDSYKSNFLGIEDSHDFYIEDNQVFIVFDKYEIAPGYRGVVEIPIDRSRITELTVGEADYRVRTDYLIKMVMLKQVADEFKLTLTWDEKERVVEVYSSANRLLSKMTVGKSVFVKGRSTKVTLETAPEIENGRTFVPVSFFDEILNMAYCVNGDGSITLSQYNKLP